MLNRSSSLPMSTSVLKDLPGKLDVKRHSLTLSILYISSRARDFKFLFESLSTSTSILFLCVNCKGSGESAHLHRLT